MRALEGALRAALPYLLDSARRNERLGLREEAAAAWAVHRRALGALRATGASDGGNGPVLDFAD